MRYTNSITHLLKFDYLAQFLSAFLRFFHVLAEKNTISGTNSNLPNNIENDKITFVKSGIVEKLLIGPK